MKYCQYCGREVPDDSIFCLSCGKRLTQSSPSSKGQQPNKQKSEQPSGSPTQEEPEEPEKKQSSLWGCTIVVLIISLVAGAVVYIYNMYAGQTNMLAPKDEALITDTIATPPAADDEEEVSEEDERSQAEFALRKTVQNMYNDVLSMDGNANYTGRYCSSELRNLILEAENANPKWIDYSIWLFSNNVGHPQIEQIQVKSITATEALVRVAVRPLVSSDVVNVITLKLLKEDGAWLVDDFSHEGKSIRTLAHRAIVEDEIKREILADTLMRK